MAACSAEHTITLDANGEVWAYGYNRFGQCGADNDGEDVRVPSKVNGIQRVMLVEAGGYYSVCLDEDGDVWVFGHNMRGQLGIGTKDKKYIPTKVTDLKGVISVSCGFEHTLCLTSENMVYAFGNNNNGQFGIDTTSLYNPTPIQVPLNDRIQEISCGNHYSVFLSCNGDVSVCGENDLGQLGLGDYDSRLIPVKNPYLSDIVHVACGRDHTVVLNSNNGLFSFGDNNRGQLCLNDKENRCNPQKISFKEGIHAISCGQSHTLILDITQRVWVFGFKELSLDRIDGYHDAIVLNEPKNVCLMSSGGDQVLLKTTSNEIWGFGFNEQSQLMPRLDVYSDIIRKPKPMPSQYSNIIGTPISTSRIKSAKKIPVQ